MRTGVRWRSWISAAGVSAMVVGMSIAGALAAGAAVGTPSLVAGLPFDVNDYGAGGMSNIGAAAQSPDGTLLALGGMAVDDGTIAVYSLGGSGVPVLADLVCAADGTEPPTDSAGAWDTSVWTCPDGSSDSVVFSPSGALLAVADGTLGAVTLFTVGGDGSLMAPHSFCVVGGAPVPGAGACPEAGPESMAFSPDGSLLAVPDGHNGTVTLFTVGGGGSLTLAEPVICAADGSPVPGPPSRCPDVGPESVAFSPGGTGNLLAVANADSGTVTLFTVGDSGALAAPVSVCAADGSAPPADPETCPTADPGLVAFTPDGGSLAVANFGNRFASLFAVGGAVLTGPPTLLPLSDAAPIIGAGLVAMSVAAAPGGGYRIVLAGRNDGVSALWVYAASPLSPPPPPPPAVVVPPPTVTTPSTTSVPPTTTPTTSTSTPTPAPIPSSSSKLAPAPAVTTPDRPAPPPATLAATGITTGRTLSLAALLILAGAGLLFAAGRRRDRRGAA